jgi:hypothetical protein
MREGMLTAIDALKNVETWEQTKAFKKKWYLWLHYVEREKGRVDD